MDKVGRSGPQHDRRNGLIGPAEVAPDQVEVRLGNEVTQGKQRDGNQQPLGHRLLRHLQELGDDQASRAESRIPGRDGQNDDTQNGQNTTQPSEKRGGDIVNHLGGATGSQYFIQCRRAFVEAQTQGAPDQRNDALADHRAVKHEAPVLFVLDAARHQRRLG